MTTSKQIALITGANRGLGYETARELGALGIHVIVGARDLAKGEQAVAKLKALGYQAEAVRVDSDQPATWQTAYDYIDSHYGKLDILVNNAGIAIEDLLGGANSSSVSSDIVRKTFDTNFFSVVALTQLLLPLVRKASQGRIVNLSSILGSLTLHSLPDSPIAAAKPFAYNASKTALNAFTVHLADELKGTSIKVNSAHPGWVKTELGGEAAPMEVADGGKTSAQLATLPADGPNGGFFHLNDSLPW